MSASAVVLSIDDDEQNLELIRDVGEAVGWRVITEQVATEALGRARALRPDVILLDVMMKELGGLEVLASLKRDPLLATTPVVFVSATVDPDVERRALALGATDFIHKPFRVLALQSRVVSALHLSLLGEPRELVVEGNVVALAMEEMLLRAAAGEPAGCSLLSLAGWGELVATDRVGARRLLEMLSWRLRRNIRSRDGIYITRDGRIVLVFPATPKAGLTTVTQRLIGLIGTTLAEQLPADAPFAPDLLAPRIGLVSLAAGTQIEPPRLMATLDEALERACARKEMCFLSDDLRS